ncbi:MAG: P-loop NTPase [Parvularculaceae bacterium]
MADNPLTERVRTALAGVADPGAGVNLIEEGRISGLVVEPDGTVRFALEVPAGSREAGEALLEAAKRAAEGVEGVKRVVAVATAHSPAPSAGGGHGDPFGLQKSARVEAAQQMMPGVKRIVVVASGKGGVGKSTLAANIAVALARKGLKTGLLDADIYGPSLPTLFGLKDKAVVRNDKIMPERVHGVTAMSIGMLVDPEQALAWRGPMVMGALRQLMNDVDWGEQDILLVDTPPGTGDAHLSLIQTKRLSGAVIVSTPQEMALADMRRGAALFRKTGTPVLGVIENMAWIENPDGSRAYVFGKGGAERAAAEIDAPFLGAVPLYPDLREASDRGAPVAADSSAGILFAALADKIAEALTAPL